ncbi:DUF72 domain-containing protein [Lysobacter sp. 1R34A]|uniref:DUF72 domain-containing protein n=1 Tax=Lysobacter sp. 1R34A TaxID=3445786 RepID=UPI003EF01F60
MNRKRSSDSAPGDLFAAPASAAAGDFGAGPGPVDGIRAGIGGWTFVPWRNNFYPEKLVQRRELEFASRQLSSIEINGTYYSAQKPATYAKWAAETPEHFVFSLKAPGRITQGGALAKAGNGAKAFIDGGLSEFGPRLGPILWQLTPNRAFDRDDLAAFLDALPRRLDGQALKHVLEVRHPSFLDEAYVRLAREHRIATVFTDSDEYPSLADLTGDFVYARLMRSRSDIATGYPDAELQTWAERAQAWAQGRDCPELPHVAAPADNGKPREVYVYFISAAKERNPAAAMRLLEKLGAR